MIFGRKMATGFAILALASLCAYGQATTGSIVGTVTDTSGAAVARAAVTVASAATGIEHHVETNDSGQFTVPLLDPGTYSVTVSEQGFRAETQTGIVLNVD